MNCDILFTKRSSKSPTLTEIHQPGTPGPAGLQRTGKPLFFRPTTPAGIKETTGKAKAVMPGKTYLDVYVKKGTDEEGIQKLIDAWYRIELKKTLPVLIDYWQ